MPGGGLFVMDHGRDCFLNSNSSLVSGRMTGRKTKPTLNNPKIVKYQWVSKITWGHFLVWMLREQDRRLKSNHKIFMIIFIWKIQKYLLYIQNIFEILLLHWPLNYWGEEETTGLQVSILVFVLLHFPKTPGVNEPGIRKWNVQKQQVENQNEHLCLLLHQGSVNYEASCR